MLVHKYSLSMFCLSDSNTSYVLKLHYVRKISAVFGISFPWQFHLILTLSFRVFKAELQIISTLLVTTYSIYTSASFLPWTVT